MSNKILVVGATGNVGSVLVKILSEQGEAIKAATRRPDDYPQLPGVEAVAFDYARPETFGPALEGVDRAFAIAPTADPNAAQTVTPLFEAAKAAGVRHLVLMTAFGVDQAPDDVPYRKLELNLINLGVPYTILRPNWFMQNFAPGFILPSIQQSGGIFLPADDAKTSFIDTRDIAAVAAAALTQSGHENKEYPLTGSQALSYGEAAAILSSAAGRTIAYTSISDDDMRGALLGMGWLPEQADFMATLFDSVRQGWVAPVVPTVSQVLNRDPISLEQYAADHADYWK